MPTRAIVTSWSQRRGHLPSSSSLSDQVPDNPDGDIHRQPQPDVLSPWQEVLHRDTLHPDSVIRENSVHYRTGNLILDTLIERDVRYDIR